MLKSMIDMRIKPVRSVGQIQAHNQSQTTESMETQLVKICDEISPQASCMCGDGH